MLRCCEQLGLLPEIIKASKPAIGNVFLDEELKYLGNLSSFFMGQRYGYFNIVLPRPDFHNILLRHVPAHKIHFSKKVLSLSQTNESAQVRCSDNSVFYADIVIGADGAYSGIRQNLYKSIQGTPKRNTATLEDRNGLVAALKKMPVSLKSISGRKSSNSNVFGGGSECGGGGVGRSGDERLPKSDQEPLRFDQHAVVGVTEGLDPEKYPFLKDKCTQVTTVIAKNGFSAWLIPVTENRICWNISSRTFSTASEKEDAANGIAVNFKISEWGPEAVDSILGLDYVKNLPCPYGGTLQDLFDKTKKGTSVRIMLEDKAYKTWYYKRTVLIGDACHKMIPFSGVGALHAVLDCIVLANALYDMPDDETFTQANITQAFQTYYALRYESAVAAVKGSAQVSHFVSNSSAVSHIVRKATLASLPAFMILIAADRIFANRPILSYLPFVPDYGFRKSNPQQLGRRDREELVLLRQQDCRRKEEEVKRLKEERRRQAVSGGSSSSGLGIVKSGASRILRAATASSLGQPVSGKPLPALPKQDRITDVTGRRSAEPYSSSSSRYMSFSASMDRVPHFDIRGVLLPPGGVERENRVVNMDDDDKLSIPDSASMYSFSSRYALPYDTEEPESQHYTDRESVCPHIDTHANDGCRPLARNYNRNKGSSDSLTSSPWRRYGRRRSLESLDSLQSSIIDSYDHLPTAGCSGYTSSITNFSATTEPGFAIRHTYEDAAIRSGESFIDSKSDTEASHTEQEFQKMNTRAMAHCYNIAPKDMNPITSVASDTSARMVKMSHGDFRY
ncbi:hypothetical protein BGZ58_009292 [Dissophora ornata]|nr:hypothetical protein BGZ58_009292 [Dissophora ornata]